MIEIRHIGSQEYIRLSLDCEAPNERFFFNPTYHYRLPEDLMGVLDPYLGDGRGSISVGADLATSDFGNKAGAHVMIRVNGNNDPVDLIEAGKIVRDFAERFVADSYNRMFDMLEAARSGKLPKPPDDIATPLPATTRAVPPKPAVRPLPTRPSFRRT